MSYTVLARKYRSRTLDEIVGQDPIVTTLKNAITSDRVHHGFLFCGTRGVGKTSTARVLAKSLNCLKAESPTVTPCCECDSCVAIAEGQDIDVIEIDAASNTGVDHIRELRNNVSYRPARARFKIYIIDEVHMLSTGAFNALLKTLEEPPPHVKFIFATTELQKVPATIQSRVQRFEFQSMPVKVIVEQINMILKAEGIEADEAVVRRVARYANGSMRDGLSLLDQLLSLGSNRLDSQLIDDILPTQHDEQLSSLIGHLADHDAAAALTLVDRYLAGGKTLVLFCENLIEHLRMLMLINVCGPDSELVDIPVAVREQVVARSRTFDAQTFVYMITVVEELRRQVRSSSAGRSLTDAAIVRLASCVNFTAISTLLNELGPAQKDAPKKKVVEERRAPQAQAPAKPAGTTAPPNLKRGIDTRGGATGGSSASGTPSERPPANRSSGSVSREDISTARSDPLVQAALERFDGQLLNVEKVKPVDSTSGSADSKSNGEGDQ